MVKANEIRCGNYVLVQGDGDPVFHQIRSMDFEFVDDDDNFPGDPISLTPEILEQCGFEFWLLTDYPGYYSKEVNRFRMRVSIDGIDAFSYSINELKSVNLMYFHQLQNLYFALTGEELVYQPIKELT